MLLQSKVLFNQFIKFSETGITIATFTEIRDAYVTRYKEIYGQDIDVSTSSADGQYIEMQCLIISNLLQAFKALYENLDVRVAQGDFLDMLCALTNVTRKPATKSRATLSVKTQSGSLSIGPNEAITYIDFLDKGGNTWTWTPTETITLDNSSTKSITVVAESDGPVRADAGWIDRPLDFTYDLVISQPSDAIIGSYAESDFQLRARRNQSIGSSGLTVIESLVGALLAIDGIEDVKVYNNNTGSSITSNDSTTIAAHSVYVIIRKRSLVDIPDSTIGTVLFEKMTPGIQTVQSAVSASRHSYTYVQKSYGTTTAFTNVVHWKEASAVKPTISIGITKMSYITSQVSGYSDKVIAAIRAKVVKYLNELPLSTGIRYNDLLVQIQLADPLFKGMPTFTISSLSIDGGGEGDSYDNPDAYYDYDVEDITVTVS